MSAHRDDVDDGAAIAMLFLLAVVVFFTIAIVRLQHDVDHLQHRIPKTATTVAAQ